MFTQIIYCLFIWDLYKQCVKQESLCSLSTLVIVQTGYVKASKFYAVQKSTLRGCVRNGNKSLGRPAIIPQPLEHELSEYIFNMESMLFVLTVDDLKLLAYELAVRNDLQNPYNKELHKAGDSWYYGFRKRQSEI